VKKLVAALMGAAALFAAPVANADDVGFYLDKLHQRGIYGSDGDRSLLRAGLEVCNQLDNGKTPMQVASMVYAYTDESIDSGDAGYIVGAAIGGLCPEYSSLVSGYARPRSQLA